jgi:mono/diheme cytochrome c family protein
MPRKRSIAFLSLAPLLLVGAAAHAADAQAGKAEFQKVCSQCHDASDWAGKSEAQLGVMIKNVATGKAKHPKKLDLTQDQIDGIAAWVSSGGSS